MKQKLLVSQIQNFSLHDGPGIRTTVFLQGCNLRCKWCHNPETWKKESILSYTENKCIGCGQCIEICPSGAQQIQNGQHIYERTLCTVCGKCVEICCTEALEIVGSYYSAEELSELLLRDRRLYEISEGGVTFSGGEPMMQAEILYDLCNRLQKEHISVAFETALAFPWKVIHRMTECADLFLVDFKMFDNEKHKEYTGTENTLIKENLKKLEVFIGPPLMEQFMKYAGFDKETAQKGIEYYRERYSEKGMYENTVYPGVENTLAELKRRGYRLAVASAKPTFYVTQIMDHFNLSRYFEVIAGTDLNGPKVTKSQVIEEALERMSLSDHRDQVIMVGDREHDILGARRCGIQCVAVSYGYGSREELEKAQPLQIVASADYFSNSVEGALSGRNPLSYRTDPRKRRASLAGRACRQRTGKVL